MLDYATYICLFVVVDVFFFWFVRLFVCLFVFSYQNGEKKIEHFVDNSVFITRNEILDEENLFFHFLLCLKGNSFGKVM